MKNSNMKRSFNQSKLDYIMENLFVVLGILCIIGSFISPILFLEDIFTEVLIILLLLGGGIYLFYIGIKGQFFNTSLYSIDDCEITLYYMKRYCIHYPWEKISEIAVADVYHPPKGGEGRLVIRLVMGEEKDGPQNRKCSKNIYGYEEWRKEKYVWKHWKQVILLDYSPERYIEIKNASGKEIKDYRTFPSEAWKVKLPD